MRKKQKPDNSMLFLLLGGGVLLYLWLQSQGTAAAATLPSDVIFGLYIPAGASRVLQMEAGAPNTTITGPAYIYYSPSTAAMYSSTVAPTAAQVSAGTAARLPGFEPEATGSPTGVPPISSTTAGSTPSTITATSITPVPTSTTASTPSTTASTPPAQGSLQGASLAALYAGLLAWAAADSNFTYQNGDWYGLPDHWSFYISYLVPNAPVTGYTWPPDVTVVFPGINVSTPMSATAFWAGMAPVLRSQFGMSGLRGMRGLGAARSVWLNNRYGGWAA